MQWKESTLKREDNSNLYCRTMGEGTPLLLIHGAAVDSEFYIDAAPLLARHYQVIIYDRTGYGRSTREDYLKADSGAAYFACQGDDAAWILQQIVPGEQAYVVGCSCGAIAALYMAARHPQLVKRVFLHEPPIYSAVTEDQVSWSQIDGIREALAQEKYNRAFNRFLLFLASSSTPSKKEPTEAEAENFLVNGMVFIRQEFPYAFDKTLPVPELQPETDVCVLWGEDGADKPLVACAARVAQQLGCPMHKIPGGHNAAREDPELFAQAVLALLREK